MSLYESGDSPEYVGTAKKLLCALVPSYSKVGLRPKGFTQLVTGSGKEQNM